MKVVDLEQTTLDRCVDEARKERIIVTRHGKPVALVVSVEGLDEEQLQLGSSDRFWELVADWRSERTLSRAELEQKIDSSRRKH